MADKNQTSLRRQIGDAVMPYLPATVAARRSADTDAAAAYNRGDVLGALGAQSRQIVTVPVGLTTDVVTTPAVNALGGIARFFKGAAGIDGGSAAAKTKSATPAKPKPTPQQAVTQALDKGAKTPRTITAQDRAMAAIGTILSQPFTIDEFNAATGALPEVAASTAKVSNKDRLYGTVGGATDVLYQAQLAQAQQLSGVERDKAVLAATETYRKNLIETLGVDPSKAALATLYAQQEE